MANPIEELFIRVGLDFRQALTDASQGTGQLSQVLHRLEQRFPRLTRAARSVFKGMAISIGVATAAAAALAAAIFVVVKASSESVKLAKEQIAAERQRNAALKSTGNITGFTTQQLNKMAAELQNVTNYGDEATIGVQALLLTFTRIGRDVFPRALATILDVSTAMGQDLKTSSIQVGKALNDPVGGVSALTRVGIQFSQQQKDQIKNFVELGDLASAQGVILDELARQFGGSAQAAREADGGVIAFKNSIGDLKELIGRPIVRALSDGFKDLNNTLADERVSATLQEWATTLGQIIGLIAKITIDATNTFLGPNGLIPLFEDGSNRIVSIIVNGMAGISAVINTGIQGLTALIQVAKGERSIFDFSAEDIGLAAAENFNRMKAKLKEDLAEFTREEEISPAAPFVPGLGEGAVEASEELREFLLNAQSELLDLQADLAMEQEELITGHAERMLEIEQQFAERRQDLAQNLARRLAELEQQTAERRAEIFADAREALADLERQTDQDLERERARFQTEERRDTEDHLREIRRLRLSFLDNLEDAVTAREKAEREEDFSIRQGRERQDTDQRLAEIRQQESERAAEIQRGLDNDLARLAENERKRRASLEASHQEQLIKLNEQQNKARQTEMESYQERQAQLDQSLSDRLAAIAKEMANEESITAEGAAQVLSALAQYFGKGGEIDKLMEDFATRRRQRMKIEIEFEGGSAPTSSGGGGQSRRPPRHAPGRGFVAQHGGSMIARSPTLAMFGEAGPELAEFTPLRNNVSQQTKRIQLDLNLSGSAPPGIRSADRDQIAGVLVNALREAGVMRD